MKMGAHQATHFNQTPNTGITITGVRPWGISFTVKRETAQTAS